MSDLSTHVFGAQHAEIAELLTDDNNGTTYDTAIDVPGLKSVTLTTSSNAVELRGDNQLLAKETVVQNVEVSLEFAKWDARIAALITGASLVEDQVTGAYTLQHSTSDTPKEFSILAVSASATGSGASVSVYFPKLKITNIPDMAGLSEEDFKTVTVVCEAIPTFNGVWFDWNYIPGA
jgi:phi13 family phage major tail protein